jgi:hypothetical protein
LPGRNIEIIHKGSIILFLYYFFVIIILLLLLFYYYYQIAIQHNAMQENSIASINKQLPPTLLNTSFCARAYNGAVIAIVAAATAFSTTEGPFRA